MPAFELKAATSCSILLLSLSACTSGGERTPDPLGASAGLIELCDYCPPGFELDEDGRCRLRTAYQLYGSLQNAGVGGLQTALPRWRDGFTPQQIDLGRYLFFDPILSRSGKLSCASCHSPELGFSDGRARSLGSEAELNRGAPSLWNVAFLRSFFWDARATTLEEQMAGPLYHPNEMGNTPQQLLQSLNSMQEYKRLFVNAFPGGQHITLEQLYVSLAAFESSLVSLNSRYDQYVHGNREALTRYEIEGFNVFRSFVARCSECHTPPLFTNQQVAVLGTPEPDGQPLDPGAEKTFRQTSLRAGFKVPSLRNVALTAPYMHSGAFDNLRETIEFYTKGRGHAVPPGEKLSIHWHIWSPQLTDTEIDRLLDFLHALTDESFRPRIPARVPSGLPVEFPQRKPSTE
jgi:cytochrome c peroxidase